MELPTSGLCASLLGLLALTAPTFADSTIPLNQRGFEIPLTGPNFIIGVEPTRAFVDGAPTAFVGNFSLYNDGFYAWLIDPGVEATITFEAPVSMFSIFARRQDQNVQGTIELLDANGGVILTVNPNPNGFEQILIDQAPVPVAQLRVINTGTTGVIALDSIDFCAALDAPSIGAPICTPAVSNSSGVPATLRAQGTSFVAGNNVSLIVNDLPAQSTSFLIGSMTETFTAQPGGSQGNLCIGGAIGRFVGPGQVMNAGALGTFTLPIDLSDLPTPTGPVSASPGDTWYFQAWYRDLVNGAATSNFTDALEVTLR